VTRQSKSQAKPAAQAPDGKQDPRLAGVLRLARECKYEQGHTHQVTRLALELFDQLRPLHRLGERERFWLQCAGLLHDIGWIEGQQKHHKTALRIILNSPLEGFADRQRQIIGCIARYHRRAEPKARHEPYGSLPDQDRQVVRTLAAILRVADSLDVTHEDRVRDLKCHVGRDEVVIDCATTGPLVEELRQILKKGGLFEKVFGRKLGIQWHPA
jgi:exopolyphosphatase/pppGpp-phosphohydrolase